MYLFCSLSYLHSKKIVHRDVKTENMLLDYERTVKIADFGVARVEAQNPSDMTGATGTYGYMAPEVFICFILIKNMNDVTRNLLVILHALVAFTKSHSHPHIALLPTRFPCFTTTLLADRTRWSICP